MGNSVKGTERVREIVHSGNGKNDRASQGYRPENIHSDGINSSRTNTETILEERPILEEALIKDNACEEMSQTEQMSAVNLNSHKGDCAFQREGNAKFRKTASSNPVTRTRHILKEVDGSSKVETSTLKESIDVPKPSKSLSDTHIRVGAANTNIETRSSKRALSDAVRYRYNRKPTKEPNRLVIQGKKGSEGRQRAGSKETTSVLNLKTVTPSKKPSQFVYNSASFGNPMAETSEAESKRRARSEPVKSKTVDNSKELGLESLPEEEERVEIESTKTIRMEKKVLENESTECSIDIREREDEVSSSLRSTTLDSRLFESESSIVTHTGLEPETPVNIYSDNKNRLKTYLLELYNAYDFGLSAFPVLPKNERTNEARCYWPPWMTVKHRIKTEEDLDQVEELDDLDKIHLKGYESDKKVIHFHDMFHNEGRETKNVYIVGESGTGKTAFCRHFIQQWCHQHQQGKNEIDSNQILFSASDIPEHNSVSTITELSDEAGNNIQINSTLDADEASNCFQNNSNTIAEPVFDDIGVLERFEFLFYIPLSYSTNHDHIHELIKSRYKNILNRLKQETTKSNPVESATFLNELLDKDSDKVLILLDGLDQWRPNKRRYKAHLPTTIVPSRDPSRQYTIITTTSPLKLREVKLDQFRPDLEITLHGIDKNTTNDLINDVSERLNKYHGKEKKSDALILEMETCRAKEYRHLPFTLEALVCLWYHSSVIGDTYCDIFSRIIELQLKRFEDFRTKSAETHKKEPDSKLSKQFDDSGIDVQLPRYFINLSHCQKHKNLIYLLGHNALLTRIQRTKDFDFTSFELYGYQAIDLNHLVKAGLVTHQERSWSLEPEYNKKVFFADERLQNFLAATYIAILCRNEAYENIGNVFMHTSKIKAVLDDQLNVFSSVESISELSDVIVMLSGLYPPTVEQLTQKIYDTASNDKCIKDYRISLGVVAADNIPLFIQKVMSDCAHEALSVNTDAVTLHFGDISYGNVDKLCLKNVVPEEVKTLTINANDTRSYTQETLRTSDFIYQSRVFSRLQKLAIKDEQSHLTLQDIESLYILSDRCSQTLKVISYSFSHVNRMIYERITFSLDRLLLNMPLLRELEIRHITLSHNKFNTLSAALSELVILKRIALSDIRCEMDRCDAEDHKMNFLEFENLESVDIDGMELPVTGVNKTHIVTCQIGNMPQGPELQTFSSLLKAKNLKHFTQRVRQRPPFISQTLIKTLNTWHVLETLHLEGVNFGENVLTVNIKLRNLSLITLVDTRMSRVSWCHFVDSLAKMSHSISVVTRDIHITPLEEDVTRDSLRRPIDAETRALILAKDTERQEAFQFVRGKTNTYRVVFDIRNMFDFETKINT